jgi:hypothetical protein
MKTYRNLYPELISFENLYQAFRKARKGKRDRAEVAGVVRRTGQENRSIPVMCWPMRRTSIGAPSRGRRVWRQGTRAAAHTPPFAFFAIFAVKVEEV